MNTTIDSNWNVEGDSEAIARALLVSELEEPRLERGKLIRGRYDNYTVLSPLTETTQSRLYHGRSTEGRRMVIKEYLQNYPSKAFEREGYIHNLLYYKGGHRNIIPAWEFIVDGYNPLGIFPYVEGRTLEEKLEEDGPFDQEEVVPIISMLCDVVDYIHDLNIIHRDIKASNVMITQLVPTIIIPQLFDFGIAWHPDIAHHDTKGGYYGTIAYMAPEKWKFLPPHKREDIYSLATLFYELLSGDVPYPVNNLIELFHTHSQRMPVPDLTEDNPFISDKINEVIKKGLGYDLKQRYQTAGEMKQAYLKAVGRK